MKGNTDEGNVIQDDTVPLFDEEDSLTSKKRFLQLNNIKTENERHTRLTTWMGNPKDYPILGLKKKKQRELLNNDTREGNKTNNKKRQRQY